MVEDSASQMWQRLLSRDVGLLCLSWRCFQCKKNTARSSPRVAARIFRTVRELVDVNVEFVCRTEGGVAYLSYPRPMTTHVTVFSIRKEIILISMQYLPCCKVTCTSSARPKTVLSSIISAGWHPFVSRVLVCSLQTVVISKSSTHMDGFVTDVCPAKTVKEIQLLLKLLPDF